MASKKQNNITVSDVEKLLEKYFEATTTIVEEEQLKKYFSQAEVAPHLEEYKPIFNYFVVAKEEKSTQNISLKPRKNNLYLKWISVAAVVAVLFGVYTVNKLSSEAPTTLVLEEHYTPEEIESAELALALLTNNFQKGTQGTAYLKEFEKNTNRFLNN